MPPRCTIPAIAAAALACAAPQQRFEDVSGAEGLIEVLPRGAAVEVDGQPRGVGAVTVPIRDREQVHTVVVRAPGFEVAAVEIAASELAGGHVGIALRPAGFGAARPLAMDDPASLVAAAALLLRAGRDGEAAEYAEHAAELAPSAPAPRRLLGDAYLRLGRKDRALDAYVAYLERAPEDAPERAEVEERVAAMRGDLTLPSTRGGAR
jgi:predicted Zn-dependent protease